MSSRFESGAGSVTRAVLLSGLLVVSAAGATLAAAGAAAPAVAPANNDPARGAWVRLDTPTFTLLGNVPESRLRAIATKVEAFHATLVALHEGSGPSPRETTLYVFADVASGWPFTPRKSTDSGEGHLGTTPPYDVGNYVTIAAPDDDPPLAPLYHAYAHQFLDDGFPRLPMFLTEGLAGFYTGFSLLPQGTAVGTVNADHVAWMRAHGGWSLGALVGLDASAVRALPVDLRRTFVAGSWATVHYLVSGSGPRRTGVPAFLGAVQRGTSAGEASRAAFGIGLDGLQDAVNQYVVANRFLPMLVDDSGVKPDATTFRATPLQRDAVLAALGDLIAHGGKNNDADAEAYVQEALRLNPRQARAHAALGYLRYARERFAEAIPPLEQAVGIDPDAMTCYLLARSLLKVNAGETPTSQTPPWLARVRLLLARATVLRPGFAAPYVTLGVTHIRPDGSPRSGIEVLEKARALLPARTDIAGSLVYLYLRAGDLARAQAMADRVIAPSGDAETLRAARQAIATYKEDVAARASLAKQRGSGAQLPGRAFLQEHLKMMREALEKAEDPERRKLIEADIARTEAALQDHGPNAVDVYNEAIAFANKREYTKAIALLEELQTRPLGDDFSAQVKATLERLRQDAARYQQAGQ